MPNQIFNLLENINLFISIRRDHLLEDTIQELSKPNLNFKKGLRVLNNFFKILIFKIKFIGEEGMDEGGV